MDNSPFSPFRPSRPNWMHTLSSPPSAFVPVLDGPPSSPWTHGHGHNPANAMTPNSTCSSTLEPLSSPEPRQPRGSLHPGLSSSGKRGRPRADLITHLMMEGSSSPSEIKCRVCNRVFPREKSLQAHLRTHTGERPYCCDFPGCSRAFTQSGQLKTHQRLHAGEKPFMCSSPGCSNRYTHANRTCPLHPYHKPQRTSDLVLSASAASEPGIDPAALASPEVARWLENYRRGKQERAIAASPATPTTPSFDTPIRTSKRVLSHELEQENCLPVMAALSAAAAEADVGGKSDVKSTVEGEGMKSPLRTANLRTPLKMNSPLKMSPLRMTPLRSPLTLSPRSGSRIRMVMSDITPTSSDGNVLKPKRRWLKEVFQEQEHQPEPQQQQQQHLPQYTLQPALPQLPQRQLFSGSSSFSSSAFKPPKLAPAVSAGDPEDLARPIAWDNEEPAMSKSWLVAATALVELGGKIDGVQSQPLNLSIARDH